MTVTVFECGRSVDGHKWDQAKNAWVDTIKTECDSHRAEPTIQVDLTGRTATCTYGSAGLRLPSDPTLAFWRYRGPGATVWTGLCKCGIATRDFHVGMGLHVYLPKDVKEKLMAGPCGGTFSMLPDLSTDEYYCGCKGWE